MIFCWHKWSKWTTVENRGYGMLTRKQKDAHAKRQRKVRARKKQQFEEMKRKLAVYEDFRNWEYKKIDGRMVGVFLVEKPKTKKASDG